MPSIKRNFVYNSIYQVLLIIIPVITTPYISRVLGAEAIGQFSYNYSIAVVFTFFITLGLNNYGNRTIAEYRNNREKLSETFWNIYLMQIISSLVTLSIYTAYMLFIGNNALSKIMIVYVLSAALDINWLFFGLEKFKMMTIRSVIIKTLMTLSIFVLVKTREDLPLYALIICLSSVVTQLSLWPYVLKNIKPGNICKKNIIKHVVPNLTLFIPVIAIGIYHYMDKVMLGFMSIDAEVGYYESSDKILNIPMALVGSLGTVMLPRVANLIANKNKEVANKYTEKSIYFAMFLSTSICCGIMAISRIFVPLYFGEGYEKCITLFYILLPSCVFLAFANVIRTQYLIPAKKDKIYIASVIIGMLINVILNGILIPGFASAGAAIGTLVTQIVVCAYQSYKVRGALPIRRYIKNSIPFILSGIVMLGSIFAIEPLLVSMNSYVQIGIEVVVGAIVYVLIMPLLLKLFRVDVSFLAKGKKISLDADSNVA